MDNKVIEIVSKYVLSHLDKGDGPTAFEVYTVWKCKVLQNWKYLLSTTLPDGMYYEVTYNGDKKEFYLDAYKKFENVCIKDFPEDENNAVIMTQEQHIAAMQDEKRKAALRGIDVKNILKGINHEGSDINYTSDDIQIGKPDKPMSCFIIREGRYVNLGKFDGDNFYTAHFTSAEDHKYDTDWRQEMYYTKASDVDAYIPFKKS